MRIERTVWIPILGIWFALFGDNNGGILMYDNWIKYQIMCCMILVLLRAIL